MSVKTKSLAKSLHTISVLIDVAMYLRMKDETLSNSEAVEGAASLLGYGHSEDPYGLQAKAVARMDADQA